MHNFISIRSSSLTKCSFLFADTPKNLAYQLFEKNGLKYNVKGFFEKEGEKYVLIICNFREKDKPLFFKSMQELERNILLMGDNDYLKFCEKTIGQMEAQLNV